MKIICICVVFISVLFVSYSYSEDINIKIIHVFKERSTEKDAPEIFIDSLNNELGEKQEQRNINDYKYLSLNDQKITVDQNKESKSILDNLHNQDDSDLRKFSKKEVNNLVESLKKHLSKSFNIVNKGEFLTLRVITDVLLFDSMKGHSFDVVEYETLSNGKIIFSGIFDQKTGCSKVASFSQGICNSEYIGKFLAKDFLRKYKDFK
jgi:hypothetical protein